MLELPLLLDRVHAGLTTSQLRWELLNIAVLVILLFLGAVAAALFLSRRKTRELTLIYFGLFSGLASHCFQLGLG